MSEWYTVYNSSRQIVGTFRHGIAFGRNPGRKLGAYDELGRYNLDGTQIAQIKNDSVFSMDGILIGEWQ